MISLAHPARVALQSAEFLALYGVFGPFEFASPLLQILLRGGNFKNHFRHPGRSSCFCDFANGDSQSIKTLSNV